MKAFSPLFIHRSKFIEFFYVPQILITTSQGLALLLLLLLLLSQPTDKIIGLEK